MRLIFLAMTAALVLGLSACTSVSPDATAHGYQEPADNPDELVCKREKPIGSKMVVKVCRTKAEIAAEERRTQDKLRKRQAETSRIGGDFDG